MISKDKISFEPSSRNDNEEMDLVLDQHVGCNKNDSSRCSEEVSDRKEEQLHLDESVTMSKTTLEDNLGSLHCEEDRDIFKQPLSSLSTHKMKSRNSSVRRFSSRYGVHWDYAGHYKKLLSSPTKNLTDSKMSKEKAATNTKTENRSLQLMEIEEARNSTSDPTHELISRLTKENSIDNQLGLDRDQREGGCERSALEETVAA